MSGSMSRKLFRPGKGSTLATYSQAVADGVMYPGDWVGLSLTVPTSQGVSGVYEGKTLGTFDYIEMTLPDSDATAPPTGIGCGSLVLGVLMGKSIGSVGDWETVTGQVLADGDVGVFQSWGVHPQGRQVATGLLGDYLTLSTVAGEVLNGVSGTVTGILNPVGVALADTSTYTRATAADEDGGPVFISRLG